MTHTPPLPPDTLTVPPAPAGVLPGRADAPSTPVGVRPHEAAHDHAETRLLAGLASATSLAGAASATWTALRAFTRHRATTNRRMTTGS